MSEESEKRIKRYNEPTTVGAGIAWAGFWIALAIFLSVDMIADKL